MREHKYRAWADGKMFIPTEEMWWYFGSYNYWSLNLGDCPGEILCDSLESKFTGTKRGRSITQLGLYWKCCATVAELLSDHNN